MKGITTFFKKNWLIVLAIGAAVYFLFINKKVKTADQPAGTGTTGTKLVQTSATNTGLKTNTVTSPLNVIRVPPPGYTGPVNGPFTWGGVGDPPDGKYCVLGNPA